MMQPRPGWLGTSGRINLKGLMGSKKCQNGNARHPFSVLASQEICILALGVAESAAVWYGVVWDGMVCNRTEGEGRVWYGVVWYGMKITFSRCHLLPTQSAHTCPILPSLGDPPRFGPSERPLFACARSEFGYRPMCFMLFEGFAFFYSSRFQSLRHST